MRCLSILDAIFLCLLLANTGHMITFQASHRIAPPHMILVAEELRRTPHSWCKVYTIYVLSAEKSLKSTQKCTQLKKSTQKSKFTQNIVDFPFF